MGDEAASGVSQDKSMSCSQCGKHFKTKFTVTRHEKTCGEGPGSDGPRDNSGGKRDGAGRHKGAAAEVKKGIGPGVDKVRKQQHKQANPSTLKPSSAASRASGGTAPTPAARPSSLLPAA